MNQRSTDQILEDIKSLVSSKGYVYALCLIILDDFHVNIEKMEKIDVHSKLNKNEVLLLLGFLIQNEINIDPPDSPLDLLKFKKSTYELLKELHHSTMLPYVRKMRPLVANPAEGSKYTKQTFFADQGMFVEPIFYSGDGLYDFQYLEFLDRKYKYDEEWLNSKADFYFDKVKRIVASVKALHQKRLERINFLEIRDMESRIFADLKSSKSKSSKLDETKVKEVKEFIQIMEFYQYEALFEKREPEASELTSNEVGVVGWESFYKNLLEIFTFGKKDFDKNLNIESFLERFTIPTNAHNRNGQFRSIGDFNLIAVKPFIEIQAGRYFIPLSYVLFEAVYESPFYWMLGDEEYSNRLAVNRGRAGEEMVYDLLVKVFGNGRVFKSVRIVSRKGYPDTDIDVLCIYGSKALCVQVKSKKLTQISRRGDIVQLRRDFGAAIQDAYRQGLIGRERILEKRTTFYDEHNNVISLPGDIDEVYLVLVTTENYPSLAHQSRILLEKKETDPNALILTVFDLELILYYLDSPFDFLYYVRQRIALGDYLMSDEEINLLGYHLTNKLWRENDHEYGWVGNDFGQLVDKNYYLFKLGINSETQSDKIENRWKNKKFDDLCNLIARLDSPNAIDIIFYLLDWSSETRDYFMDQITSLKAQTKEDAHDHNFSMGSGAAGGKFGITYISWKSNNHNELARRLSVHCHAKKYKSKFDVWIGLGSLKDSPFLIDLVFFNKQKWAYEKKMNDLTKDMFEGTNKGRVSMPKGERVGRNDQCPCGSGLKFKRCHGR